MKVKPADIVCGIPSAEHFKKLMGLRGFSMTFRTIDPAIKRIIEALARAERLRALMSERALPAIRSIRRQCFWYLADYQVPDGPQKNQVQQLLQALNTRINLIAVTTHGPHRQRDQNEMNLQNQFEAFYDRCAANPVTGAGRALDAGYSDERAAQGIVDSTAITRWRAAPTTLGLKDWYETVYKWELEDRPGNSNIDKLIANIDAGTYGVRYLGLEERKDFKVLVRGGVVTDAADFRVHTGAMKSTSSGMGWGIYVLDHYHNLYVGAHETDRFHHSSFLSGAPVQAAGEIAINAGRVVGITNKTGHYKAGPLELKTAVDFLRRSGVIMNQIAVGDPFNARGKWVSGTTALAANGDLKTVADADLIPTPQRVPE